MNDWGALIDAGAPLLEWSDRQYLPQSAAVPSCLTVLIDGAMDAQNNPFAVPLDSKKKKKKQQADESVHLNDRLVRKTPLFSHLFIMTINLPRQARDKHHEKLRKKEAVSAARVYVQLRRHHRRAEAAEHSATRGREVLPTDRPNDTWSCGRAAAAAAAAVFFFFGRAVRSPARRSVVRAGAGERDWCSHYGA
jgi:hypothetical protein